MKELRWKFFWCLFPVTLGLLVIAVAWYNYGNPPLKIGNVTLSRLKFKLGVDLVGGTILVYEIDPDKKPENYNKDQLITALKRRLDPADLYNITIRPLSDTRVEIILPTGGKATVASQRKAWNELLDAVEQQWPKAKKDDLTAKRGDLGKLAEQIRAADPSTTNEEIETLFAKEYAGGDKELTGDDVERIKDLIQRVGSLEFRMLANRTDDAVALDIAKAYFDAAASSWKEFLDRAKTQYPGIDKPTEKISDTTEDIACGDRDGIIELILKHRPTERLGDVKVWVNNNLRANPQLLSLMRRAESGQAPEAPIGGDGKTFRITLNDGEHRVAYSWIEVGKNELHSLKLNNSASDELHWKGVARARNQGALYEGDPRSSRVPSPLYSRKITNPSRLSAKDKDKKYEYFFLTRDPEPDKAITGEMLTSAKEVPGRSGERSVGFSFNGKGENLFYDVTNANSPPATNRDFKRNLAIVLDGQIMSAPNLNSAIRGNGVIEGKFSKEELDALINILRSGALPATLKPQPVSESTLGATLGQDTIDKGTMSIGIAFVAILIFMLVYYRFAGLVACIALIANLILTIAFMVVVNATFTLPGLAGLVLTLGMAVDANVLIYERLREERERGASLSLALRNGYERALPTIIDTHLTSILTAIVLYIVGNDQLKGFGISLTVGLLISLWTSLYVTRVIFRFWEINGWLTDLKMAKLFAKPNIHFMNLRKPIFIATVATAVLGVAIFLARGRASLNMDFIGGTVYGGKLTESVSITELRELLESEAHQRKMLALEKDPELLDNADRRWRLTYKEGQDNIRVIRMTENVTATEMRQRAETLPEPSLENDGGDKSRRFTVRTTEKSAELVGASVSRLLGDLLEKTVLTEYTLPQLNLFFAKPVTVEQARRVVMPALYSAKIVERNQKNMAIEALPLAGQALAVLGNAQLHTNEVSFVGKEEGTQKGTYRVITLNLQNLKTLPDGAKLLEALKPLAEDDPGKKKEKELDVQVTESQLNLSDYTYLSQVKTLMDTVLKGTVTQEVTLSELNRKDEEDGRYKAMKLSLPAPVDGGKFFDVMDTFGRELKNRPLPERLENFDSALAGDTQQRALYAIVASWGAMLLFLWFRFGNWTFGLAAVLCLIHDVCFTLGIIAACHYLYPSFISEVLALRDFKIDLQAVAALLTLIGFSVNDTIVVFDRIREVRGKNPTLTPEMINDSINQTLSRTVLTSVTAWLVVFVLYVFGGEGVHLFGFVMMVGVIIGTFSSITVASPLLLILGEGAPRATVGQRIREEPKPVETEE